MKEIMITSSVLILCIMLIRVVFKGKISSRLQYALWLLAALRLVIPFSAQISMPVGSIEDFRVMDLVELLEARVGDPSELLERPVSFTMSLEGGFGDMMAEWLSGKGGDSDVARQADGPTSVFLAGRIGAGWIDVFRGLWIGGMLLAAAWMLATNFFFWRRLRKGRREFVPAGGSGDKAEYESTCMDKQTGTGKNEKKSVKIYVVDELASPCLYGFPGREAIYLTPDAAEDEKRMRHVLTHEMCHSKHGDSFWSILRSVLVVVYWVNPLVWAAAFLSKRDCELACDEAALMLLGEDQRIPYGETLLSIITKKSRLSDLACTATTMTGSGRSVKERIRFIAEKPRVLGAAVVAALLLVLVVSVMVFTKNPRLSGGTWEEGDAVVISGELMVRLPETIAGISGYHIEENSGDILVYQVSSGREAGRFRALSFGEAVVLAEEGREIVPLGSYGRNPYLRQYLGLLNEDASVEVTEHNYLPDEAIGHTYIPGGAEGSAAGMDSNSNREEPDVMEDDTTYVLEGSVEYLPDEEIVTVGIPAAGSSELCYIYVKADDTRVKEADLDEMEYINRELEAVVNQAVIVSADREVGEKTFTDLAKNRTAYLGDASKVSALVNALPQPEGLAYTGIELHTDSDTELALDILYEMTAGRWEDVDEELMHVNAVMLFATIGNLEKCNFRIEGDQGEIKAEVNSQSSGSPASKEMEAGMLGHYEVMSIESISFERTDLEKKWGELWNGDAQAEENVLTEQLKSLYAQAVADSGMD